MQGRKNKQQLGFSLAGPLEQRVPADYWLRRVNRVLDLSFVHQAVRDRYCQTNGRASIDPEVILRLFLLQALKGISSVRELMSEVEVNIAYRWFIGYEEDETLPDHSTLSRALSRFGDALFDELFGRVLAQCRQAGLVSERVLHVDATSIRADLAKHKVDCPESADPDAHYGRFADGTIQPGYKQQTVVDDACGVIVAVAVTAANAADERALVPLLDAATARLGRAPEAVCADGGYASGANAAACEARQVRLVSPPQPVPANASGCYEIDQFEYDEERDEFVCPAGERLGYVGPGGKKNRKRVYRASAGRCRGCPLKSRCTRQSSRRLTVGREHGALMRLRADHRREDFRRLYRRRAPVIEGVFAQAKQRHGLRRAWRRGLAKMRIQCLLVAVVINLKRLVASFALFLRALAALQTLLQAHRRTWPQDQSFTLSQRFACRDVA